MGAGSVFVLLVLVLSGSLTHVEGPAPEFLSLDIWWGSGPTLRRPLVYGMLVPGIWLAGYWSQFLLVGAGGILFGANVAAVVRNRRYRSCRMGACTTTALLPSLFSMASCCGGPVLLVLGVSAAAPLYRLTPWLLLASVALLGGNLLWLRWRRPRPSA